MTEYLRYFLRKETALKCLGLLLILTFLMVSIPQQQPALGACAYKYKVQAGDTLYAIAALYNVTLTELADANDLKSPYVITVGQILCIPTGATKPSATKTPSTTTTTSDDDDEDSSNEAYSVVSSGDVVWVGMANFEKEHFYYLKAYDGGAKYWTASYYKLGIFQTDNEGKYGAWWHLPANLRDKNRITICVKDAIDDDLEWCHIVAYNWRKQWE
ncbi:MAG: LysM peptidoglycan-binding domain-containing protein [Anaerolineales bacterium]|nr:LysM peptidoglycan-binding domain-containing protein [Anaerolineales bacterium]